ncbi:DUF2935 domain-containing protein [Evansella sp. LMS18]|uniref:DUF2935 domain-containing protein n=1 Tax=Evansella sp. LMS18 TaxID=2924033 RepID=UPI0020D040C7|nr:DUF2935 domain-containing protein [Evansella sp. LMS18]UTR12296.1 DUF2935 domain-containing protein [Evansella sp. LMS18]
MPKVFEKEALFELRFWIQVLGDHARFIHDSLSPAETSYVRQAEKFIQTFDSLLGKVRKIKGTADKKTLNDILVDTEEAGLELRKLKLSILREHLVGKIKITLPPSFLSHMVNELDEALRVLSFLVKGEIPPDVHPLHHDLLWLLDAAGHAGAITDNLDRTEYDIRHKGQQFKVDWEEFYLKAVELAGYLRSNISRFPALSRFHKNIELEMTVFKVFLRELEEMELNKEILGVLSPLMADHMAREECYYLMKLAETTELSPPACDPGKPRTES